MMMLLLLLRLLTITTKDALFLTDPATQVLEKGSVQNSQKHRHQSWRMGGRDLHRFWYGGRVVKYYS